MNRRKVQRIERAASRVEERTPRQQLDVLNNRLGQGVGAKKERARLVTLMVAEDKAVPIEAVEEVLTQPPVLTQADVELAPVVKRERKRNRKGNS